MNKTQKFAGAIISGGAAWIFVTYVLIKVFGDSRLVGLFVLTGWIILAAYVLKYIALLRKK